MSDRKRLIILRGLPGSGKTTLARFLSVGLYGPYKDYETRAFSADSYFEQWSENTQSIEYNFDIAKLGAAHLSCQRLVEEFMQKPYDDWVFRTCIVHNTSTTEKGMKPYLDLAEKYGYQVISLIVENRHGNASVHGVPEETMTRMEERFSVKL